MGSTIVLYFDRRFDDADRKLGLTKAARIRMRSTSPTEDITVLVARGFSKIPRRARSLMADLRYRLVDAGPIFDSVRKRLGADNISRVAKPDSFGEACFLRWFIIEEYFNGGPVLAMDSDIVWRVEPSALLQKWEQGGSFLLFGSPCLTFIKDREWFRSYREGLDRLIKDPAFGKDYARSQFTGIPHDQALCQYLIHTGLMRSDSSNINRDGIGSKYFLASNPLGIVADTGGALRFTKVGDAEFIDGKQVPFWHMQTGFIRYLFFSAFLDRILGNRDVRVPYEIGAPGETGNLAYDLLAEIHDRLARKEVTFPQMPELRESMRRASIYDAFFDGGLAERVFTGARWWKAGVWSN